jgi:hypothetical protein
MTGRALIVIVAFLLSACASTLSSTPLFPKVKMEGNRLVEPEYGYTVQIPDGWTIVDENHIEKLDPDSRKRMNQEFNRLVGSGLRALFLDGSGRAVVSVFAQGTAFKEQEDLITSWRKSRQDIIKGQNNRLGYEHLSNLEFNRFRNLTDANASWESSDGSKFLSYLTVYSFKQSVFGVDLSFGAPQSEFDSCLPLFYDCVNSLSVSGRTARPREQEPRKAVDERLEELKRLKDRNLITDEDYDKKKKQILNDL